MNAELLDSAQKLCAVYDPNEIAFAIATTYNIMSRGPAVSDCNRRIYKKIATQYSRINGHFLIQGQAYNDETRAFETEAVPGKTATPQTN